MADSITIPQLPTAAPLQGPDLFVVYQGDSTKKVSFDQLAVTSTIAATPWSPDHTAANGNPYLLGDAVYYEGNIYVAKAGNDGISPTNGLYWTNLGPGYRIQSATSQSSSSIQLGGDNPQPLAGAPSPGVSTLAARQDHTHALPSKSSLGLGNVDNTSDLNKPISTATQTALSGKAALNHTHTKSDVGLGNVDNTSDLAKPVSTATQTALDGKAALNHTHTKSDVGLSNVDNTSDLNKPISTATQTALNNKAALNHTHTKSDVGLGNVDNTSDLNKPISLATQTALDGKAALSHTHTKGDVGLGNVDNTSDLDKPISTATQTALDSKAALNHTHTKSDVGLGNVDNTSDLNKPISTATQSALNNKANLTHAHEIADVTGLTTALSNKADQQHSHVISNVSGLQQALDAKQAAGDYATLDVSGRIPSSQLPSYVDDIMEYDSLPIFPEAGESGKIYVDKSNNKVYRWSGSTYVEIASSPGSTDSVSEGSTNLYFTPQRAASAAPVQSVSGKTGSIVLNKGDVGLGNADNTSDLDKPISTATQQALDRKITFNYSPTTPTQAQNGDRWVDTTTATEYVYISGSWVDLYGAQTAIGWADIEGKPDTFPPSQHAHTISEVDGLADELDAKQPIGDYATLDTSGKVPAEQLPSYADDVLEYTDLASFPETGESGKIYVDTTSNSLYRWNGNSYVEIVGSASIQAELAKKATSTYSDTAPAEAVDGDRWLDSTTAIEYVYIDGAWVEISGGQQSLIGPQGEQGPIGLTAFTYDPQRVYWLRGGYQPGEIVYYAGQYWICILPNDALPPNNAPQYWAPYSMQGPQGPAGQDATIGYALSAVTNGISSVAMTGDSMTLEVGESWQFTANVLANNRKRDKSKSWIISGIIRKTFGGAVMIMGSLDIKTFGNMTGGNVNISAGSTGLIVTVTGVEHTLVDWEAIVTAVEETSTQQPMIGGCTDPDVSNYNASADYNDGSCAYPAFPSSPALELITANSEIMSLDVTSGSNSLYPSFDPSIKDYYVITSAAYLSNANYSVTINGGSPITGATKAGRTLQITDGTNYYYVRLLPNNVTVGSVSYGPQDGYVDGYYLSADAIAAGNAQSYFYVYDKHGVPVWYGKTSNTQPISLKVGSEANTLALNTNSNQLKSVLRLNSASVSSSTYQLLQSPTYGSMYADLHELLSLAAPLPRAGNIVIAAYSEGFYIQEQSPDGELVWEWHSKEYFNSQDPEFYHLNSVDVSPVTGDILVSLRDCSAIVCISYTTKEVLWVMQGVPSSSYGTLQSTAKPSATSNTKWLTLSGEPTYAGFQYQGTRAQHDARFRHNIAPLMEGNIVISAFDNQSEQILGFTPSGAAPRSRGVIYEIDLTNNLAIHRSSIFSDVGNTVYIGSYTILDTDGTFSHAVNFSTEHPPLVEYTGAVGGTKTKVFAMDIAGHLYRIQKVPLSSFRLDNLRATCGVNIDTGVIPAGAGGGGGGSSIFAGTIAHWSLSNDGSGNLSLADASGNGNNLTMIGTVGLGTGVIDGCATFNGDGSNLETPGGLYPMDGQRTYSLWVKFNSEITGYQFLMVHGGTTDYQSIHPIYLETNGAITTIFNVDGNTSGWDYYNNSYTPPPIGVWNHIVNTLDRTSSKLYLNGTLISELAYSGAIYPPTDSEALRIGEYYAAPSFGAFNGDMCEITIFNRAISATEVEQLYNNGNGVPFSSGGSFRNGLLAEWLFASGAELEDTSGKGLTLANSGVSSISGGIATFTGSGSLSCPLPYPQTGSLTFACIINPTDLVSLARVVGDAYFSGATLSIIETPDGNFVWGLGGNISGNCWVTLTPNVRVGVVATYDANNGNTQLYINGELAVSGTDTSIIPAAGWGDFYIGAASGQNQNYLGTLEAVRIWDRVLTQGEIAASEYSNGLVGRWLLEETSGTRYDNSGRGMNLTEMGSVSRVQGKVNYGAKISLGNSGVNYLVGYFPAGINDNKWSVSLWVKPLDEGAAQYYGDGYAPLMIIGDFSLIINIFDSPYTLGSWSLQSLLTVLSETAPFNTWKHLAAVIDNDAMTVKLYVNGQLAATTPTTDYISLYGNGGTLTVGADAPTEIGTGRYCTAVHDEVCVWNRALSGEEIMAVFNRAGGV